MGERRCVTICGYRTGSTIYLRVYCSRIRKLGGRSIACSEGTVIETQVLNDLRFHSRPRYEAPRSIIPYGACAYRARGLMRRVSALGFTLRSSSAENEVKRLDALRRI